MAVHINARSVLLHLLDTSLGLLRLCREYGVRTLATYILGLPGEDREDIVKTVEFAVRLDSDFVSFNTLIPRAGTQIRQYAINSGWIAEGNIRMDQSGTYAVMGNEALT